MNQRFCREKACPLLLGVGFRWILTDLGNVISEDNKPRVAPDNVTARGLLNNGPKESDMEYYNNATPYLKEEHQKPHAIVGAGALSSTIWRSQDLSDKDSIHFNVFRINAKTGDVTQRFSVSDIPDLARLVQVLALAISVDDAINSEMGDDLSCLAACLDQVLPGKKQPVATPRLQGGVYPALRSVLDYLLEDEQRHFSDHPSGSHIYRSLLVIESWLAKTSQDTSKADR